MMNVRLLLGIVFVFITAPVSSHLIGRAAYRTGVKLLGQERDGRFARRCKGA